MSKEHGAADLIHEEFPSVSPKDAAIRGRAEHRRRPNPVLEVLSAISKTFPDNLWTQPDRREYSYLRTEHNGWRVMGKYGPYYFQSKWGPQTGQALELDLMRNGPQSDSGEGAKEFIDIAFLPEEGEFGWGMHPVLKYVRIDTGESEEEEPEETRAAAYYINDDGSVDAVPMGLNPRNIPEFSGHKTYGQGWLENWKTQNRHEKRFDPNDPISQEVIRYVLDQIEGEGKMPFPDEAQATQLWSFEPKSRD